MLGRREKLPVAARLEGAPSSQSRTWALGSADLEELRGLLERLEGKGSILVTGSEQGVGPVATGLAAAAIAAGRRAALVECELARPRLAAQLGIDSGPGLHEYLRGEAEANRILQSLVPAGPASRRAQDPLVCVVGGEPAADQEALLATETFSHAATRLRHGYELVVFAGPWLDAPLALEAVATEAEAALVCVPPGRLEGRSGRAVRTAAKALPTEMLGAVLVGDR